MGISSDVEFSSKDVEEHKKLAEQTIKNLKSLGHEVPQDLYDVLENTISCKVAVTELNEECYSGFTVDITKLPKHITLIHFKNCY